MWRQSEVRRQYKVEFVYYFAEDLVKMQYPHFFSQEPPNIYHWLYRYLRKEECTPFPCIPSVTLRLENVIMVSLHIIIIIINSCWECFEYLCWRADIELMKSLLLEVVLPISSTFRPSACQLSVVVPSRLLVLRSGTAYQMMSPPLRSCQHSGAIWRHTYSAAVTTLTDTTRTYSIYSGPRGGVAA